MHVYNAQFSRKYNQKYKNPIGMYEYLKRWNDQIFSQQSELTYSTFKHLPGVNMQHSF